MTTAFDTWILALAAIRERVRTIKYSDRVEQSRANLKRFRRGELTKTPTSHGFDPAFYRHVLD